MAAVRGKAALALAVLALVCGAAYGAPARKLLQQVGGDSLPHSRVAVAAAGERAPPLGLL